jgi:hypothetical protein
MLHCEEMLKSPFFPALLVKPDGFDPSNDLIISFLKSWSGAGHGTVDGLLKCLNDVLTKKGMVRFRRALSKAPGYLSSMQDSEVEGWQQFRADIIPDLQDILNGYSPSKLESKAYSSEEPDCNANLPKAYLLDSEAYLLLQNAVSALQSLKDSALLFKMLARMPKGKPFEGTSHCEANICAFWSTDLEKRWKNTADQLDVSHMNVVFTPMVLMFYEIQGAKGVIGISKLCCLVCRTLIHSLHNSASSTRPFIVRGSQNTIWSCTLPAWLPESIVGRMNMIYGSQLRRELVTLMHSPPLV